MRLDPADRQVGLTLAVRPAPACTRSQLGLSYLGGEPAAGNDFGELVLRDVAARPCRLAGPVRITGVNAQGVTVTHLVTGQVLAPGVLSPHVTGTVRGAPTAGALAEAIRLTAEYRDDSKSPNGLCTPHWVIPARWSVRLAGGAVISVRNSDPANPGKLVRSGGFVTCRGRFGLVSAVTYYGLP